MLIHEPADSSDCEDPIEPTERALPIEATDRADPTDPMDSTEPTEPIDSTESWDHRDSTEPEGCRRTDGTGSFVMGPSCRCPAADGAKSAALLRRLPRKPVDMRASGRGIRNP
ncbi:hypothetical protein FBY37_3914 [Streptomyces sp. SLBN-134]|nr:hypothetical protein FBY37_3914 [Streptomyces sp. SLBN-134]